MSESEHLKLEVALGRIEEKIDAQNKIWATQFGIMSARLEKIEESAIRQGERLGRLESAEEMRKGERKVLAGAFAILSGICGFLGSILVKIISANNN